MEKQKIVKFYKKLIAITKETKFFLFLRNRFCPHIKSFWLPWFLLGLIFCVVLFDIPWKLWCLSLLLVLFAIALIFNSMNIIHGLIGTRGDIKIFFGMFFVINVMFFFVYYLGFFKDAGITYDDNLPHVEFNIFEHCDEHAVALIAEKDMLKQLDENGKLKVVAVCKQKGKDVKDRSNRKFEHLTNKIDTMPYYYHRISPVWVLQNTLLTSLMQEPTEFYSSTCTYNGHHDKLDQNKIMATCFHWFLVFHILISWIFLGVFISLIYQKFRNM